LDVVCFFWSKRHSIPQPIQCPGIQGKVERIIFSDTFGNRESEAMNHSGMEKIMLGALLMPLFLMAASCQTVSDGKPPGDGMAEHGPAVQPAFNRERLCSLLTKEEVGAVLKQRVEEPRFFVNECSYRVIQPSPIKEFSIQISKDDGSGFNHNREFGRRQGRRIKEVQGIGSAAYFDDAHFHVLK
jgi:hypothetical protein